MKYLKYLLPFAVLLLLVLTVAAQDMSPSVTVSDQVSLNGAVVIDDIISTSESFIVIHKATDDGGIGPVIGYRQVANGHSVNVSVPIDTSQATTTLFAMLHTDDNEVGVYEFGQVEGADGPVVVDGAPLSPPFNVEIVRAYDQFLDMDTVHIANVVTAQDGWLVVHADGGGHPGPVLGYSPVSAGSNSDVVVALEGDITGVLFPMLHVDTGVAGTYEFGQVEGADSPVAINGVVATFPITTDVPAMRVPDQIVTDSVVAESVLSEGPGWLVIHADGGGSPGAVIGYAAVSAGTNTDVVVEVDTAAVTPVVYPMLHVDVGTVGEYEFPGDDGPVRVNDAVLVFPINAAPSITYSGSISGSTVTVDSTTIDAQGWLVIHADGGGSPGAVLGFAPLVPGLNTNVAVELEGDITETVYPMLHYDLGTVGVYEFPGDDGPVRVGEAVVTGPMTPSSE